MSGHGSKQKIHGIREKSKSGMKWYRKNQERINRNFLFSNIQSSSFNTNCTPGYPFMTRPSSHSQYRKMNYGYRNGYYWQQVPRIERESSPLNGSEEYTLRKIQETSDLIKRQLMSPGNTSSGQESSNKIVSQPKQKSPNLKKKIASSKVLKKGKIKRDGKAILRQKFEKNNSSENKPKTYNIKEIHNQIMIHISKLNYGRKCNFINANSTNFDATIQEIYKEKSLELSKALREMSHQEKPEASEIVNSIIPDFAIKFEELPIDVIRELSSTFERNIGVFDERFLFSSESQVEFNQPLIQMYNSTSVQIPYSHDGSCSGQEITDSSQNQHFSSNNDPITLKLNDKDGRIIHFNSEDKDSLVIKQENLEESLVKVESIECVDLVDDQDLSPKNDENQEKFTSHPIGENKFDTQNICSSPKLDPSWHRKNEDSNVVHIDDDNTQQESISSNHSIHCQENEVPNLKSLIGTLRISTNIFEKPQLKSFSEPQSHVLSSDGNQERIYNLSNDGSTPEIRVSSLVNDSQKASSNYHSNQTEFNGLNNQPRVKNRPKIKNTECDRFNNVVLQQTPSCNTEKVGITNSDLHQPDKTVGDIERQPVQSEKCNEKVQQYRNISQVVSSNSSKLENRFGDKSQEQSNVNTNQSSSRKEQTKVTKSRNKCHFLKIKSFPEPKNLKEAAEMMLEIDEAIDKLTKVRQFIILSLAQSQHVEDFDRTETVKRKTTEDNQDEGRTTSKKMCENVSEPKHTNCTDNDVAVENRLIASNAPNLTALSVVIESPEKNGSVGRIENSAGISLSNTQEATDIQVVQTEQVLLNKDKLSGAVLVYQVLHEERMLILGTENGKIIYFHLDNLKLEITVGISRSAITCLQCVHKPNRIVVYTGTSTESQLKVLPYKINSHGRSVNLEDGIRIMRSQWGYFFIGGNRGYLTRYNWQKDKIEFEDRISEMKIQDIKTSKEGALRILVILFKDENGTNQIHVRNAMTALHIRTIVDNQTVNCMVIQYSSVYFVSGEDVYGYNFCNGDFLTKFSVSAVKWVLRMRVSGNLMLLGCSDGIYAYNLKNGQNLGSYKFGSNSLITVLKGRLLIGTYTRKLISMQMPAEMQALANC